jgi:hypothetical protein
MVYSASMNSVTSNHLSREEVLFNWSLAEAYSPRWREEYIKKLAPELWNKILRQDFTAFSLDDQDALISLLYERRTYLVDTYIHEASRFKLIDIAAEMLELLPVMPSFSYKDDPVPLGHYIDWDRSPEWKDDPRNHAAEQLKNLLPHKGFNFYPIIAYSFQTRCDVLIEGYVRCTTSLWRKRAGETIAPLRIVYCEVEQNRRLPGFYKP